MALSIFSDLVANIDEAIAASFAGASAGMSAYVMPVAWAALGVTVLIWAVMIMDGKIQSAYSGWLSQGVKLILILQAASVFYGPWVSAPLFALPDDLTAAVSGAASSTTGLDALSTKLDQLILGLGSAAVDAFTSLNIGGAVMLICAMIGVSFAGALLEIACVFNMIYAKIGLALLLGVGPFFVVALVWSQSRNYFYSWLNTVLYFVFLSVMSTMVMVIFVGIANKFMDRLAAAVGDSSAAGASFAANVYAMLKAGMSSDPAGAAMGMASATANVVSIAFQMVLAFLPMFFVAMELRTLVSSMTGGSGGSFGSGVTNAVQTIMRMKK